MEKSDTRCSAYQLGTYAKRAVSAKRIWEEIVSKTGDDPERIATIRRALTTEPFFCSEGSPLTFHKESKRGAVAHFQHKVSTVPKAGHILPTIGAPSCACSAIHVQAQALLMENVDRLLVHSFWSCGLHQAPDWTPPTNAFATLEKSAHYKGRLVRYDVDVTGDGGAHTVIEVRHKHATLQEDRPPGTIEVGAEAVIYACNAATPNGPIVLKNLFTVQRECPECVAIAAEARAAADARVAAARAATEARTAAARAAMEAQMAAARALQEKEPTHTVVFFVKDSMVYGQERKGGFGPFDVKLSWWLANDDRTPSVILTNKKQSTKVYIVRCVPPPVEVPLAFRPLQQKLWLCHKMFAFYSWNQKEALMEVAIRHGTS